MKKIPTLFERVFENHKIIGINPTITKGCGEAFALGVATVKYDGSCCAIIDGGLYKRYDAKKGKTVPEGAIKCQDAPDPITGHFPCWIKCDKKNPADIWFIEAAKETMKGETMIFGKLITYEYMSQTDLQKFHYIRTYEAVGPHFQGNPYNLSSDILIRHGSNWVDVERTFEGVKKWLEEHDVEGLVFWYDGEPVCKIKRSDFGLPWNNKGGKR